MIKIFDIETYAIAAPDALLCYGASPNTARSTIADTNLDKLLWSKMHEPMALDAIRPQTRESKVLGGYLTKG